MAFLDGTGLGHLIEKIKAAFVLQSDTQTVSTIDIDSTPTASSTNLVTSGGVKSYVDGAINALPEPMVFQGTIGTSGTSSTVPSSPTEGDTYKIIEGGTSLTFTGISDTIKVGDTVIYKNSTVGWVLIPSGDEPSGTVTSITAGAGLNTTSNDTGTDGGTISSSGTLYLTKSGVTAGTYQGITVDKYGRITAASDQGYGTYSKPSGGIPASDLASGVIPDPEIYWMNSSDTYASLSQKFYIGVLVLYNLNGKIYQLFQCITNTLYFASINNNVIDVITIPSSGSWSTSTITLQSTSDKVSTLSSYESNTTKYPNCKAVYDALPVANPTVPSGTTPTAMTGIQIGSSYYSIAASATAMTNSEIDTAVNTAWV